MISVCKFVRAAAWTTARRGRLRAPARRAGGAGREARRFCLRGLNSERAPQILLACIARGVITALLAAVWLLVDTPWGLLRLVAIAAL